MKPYERGSTLNARLTDQSAHFFDALGIGFEWLQQPARDWEQIPPYLKLAEFAHHLPIENTACERMVKRTTDYLNTGGRSEQDLQSRLLNVGLAIKRLPSARTKKELASSLSPNEGDS